MSFSGKVKEELAEQFPTGRHCLLAETAAISAMCGTFETDSAGEEILSIHTENAAVARKCFTLLEKTFNIGGEVSAYTSVRSNPEKGSNMYYLLAQGEGLKAVRNASVQAVCCKRAYLRGAFLAAGSVSDPSKSYHLEIVCGTEERAQYLRHLMIGFGTEAKIVRRKKSYVVYLKDGTGIVDMLNVMEAHVALMELENVRILKEMRNSVNRKVNCETANINKTVSAAVKQMEDIVYIRDYMGFDRLPEGLRDVALTRLDYPEATLKELGSLLETPVGKSGVNHRLRKLSEIAEKLRENQGGTT
ncbi:MAG: DNA-binding protein WhiA [Eubacteriales bacterium]|nr:DNA-binding protein WhiA [Eubacteriales bacterium]